MWGDFPTFGWIGVSLKLAGRHSARAAFVLASVHVCARVCSSASCTKGAGYIGSRSRQLRSGFPRAHHKERLCVAQLARARLCFRCYIAVLGSRNIWFWLSGTLAVRNRVRSVWACRAVGGVCLNLRRAALSCERCSVAQAIGGLISPNSRVCLFM